MHGTDVLPARHGGFGGGVRQLTEFRAVLLDIEGTTTPIEFVHQVLFPYARAHVREHLQKHDIDVLVAEHAAEPATERDLPRWDAADPLTSAETYVSWLMDRDRKSTGLKSLQGRIWEAGYRSGELKGRGEVYPDVRPALARWQSQGKQIAIFSSGSVLAQRNLFANTTAGDLSSYLSGYFDTTTGPKRSPESYARIARALGRDPKEILFVSDVTEELDAARHAGMRTALCVRGKPPAASSHRIIHSFDEL